MFLPEDTVQLFLLKLNPCSVNKLEFNVETLNRSYHVICGKVVCLFNLVQCHFIPRLIFSPALRPIVALSCMTCAVPLHCVRLSWRWEATLWPGTHSKLSSSLQPMRIRTCTHMTYVGLTSQSTCTWITCRPYLTWITLPPVRSLWRGVLIKLSGFLSEILDEAGEDSLYCAC